MSLAARCLREFTAKVRAKGEDYFKSRAVEWSAVDAHSAVGMVRGNGPEPYRIVISWAAPEIGVVASCTCLYYEGGDFCKHLWAALLKIDAEGLAAGLDAEFGESNAPLALIHRFERNFDDEDEGESWDASDPEAEQAERAAWQVGRWGGARGSMPRSGDAAEAGNVPAEAGGLPIADVAPRGVLRIFPAPDATGFPHYHKADRLYAEAAFDYDGVEVALEAWLPTVFDPVGSRVIRRHEAAEERLIEQLSQLRVGPQRPLYYYDPPGNVEFPLKKFDDVVRGLAELGWAIEAEGRLVRRAGQTQALVRSGVDWFDLDLSVEFGGAAIPLPRLLAALQRKERFVVLDDGSQGLLPEEWLARWGPLAELAEVEGEQLRFRPSQAMLLDVLLAEQGDKIRLEVDRQFVRVRDRLRSFAGVEPRAAPADFRGELRGYQREGLGWLAFLADFGLGGCLADDMGLGKTVQVLAWLAGRQSPRQRNAEHRPTLVVAPKSVVFNWLQEAERFAPQLRAVDYTGTQRHDRVGVFADADLVVTTYGTMRQDVELLREQPFDYVILDEAQAIKNPQSVSAKAARLLNAAHRLALTGTPVENRLSDLWSIFEFLNPGMLGRSRTLQAFAGGGEERLESLRRALAPFILRRTKDEVLKELPEKTEQTLFVELLPADRKRYNELREHYRASLLKQVEAEGMKATRMHVLESLLRLRQAACHGGLLDAKLADKPSAKLETLLEHVEEIVAEGHKAIVFSQFTSLLAIVRTQLDAQGVAYEYLDGKTRNRQQRVERFQNDAACPLFLVSLKAGGTGLNLTAADYVFLLDPWWNPAAEAQAIDRAHRLGQQRPVFAYRLVARDTVEEKILQLQQRKRKLADAIVSGDGGPLAEMTAAELGMLLS